MIHIEDLQTILLEISYSCNLYCGFCYVEKTKRDRTPIPPLENILQLIDLVHSAGVKEIVLLGGEPFLNPYLKTICSEIASRGFISRGIVTNGTIINTEALSLIRDCGFWVDISVRGPNTKLTDKITNSVGTFDKVVEGLTLLARTEIPVGIEYESISENSLYLYDTVKLAIDLGVRVKQVQLHRFIPSGSGGTNLWLTPTIDDYQNLLKQMKKITLQLGIPTIYEDGLPLCLFDREYWDVISKCGCGYSILTIEANGNVRHCACNTHVLGNVFETPLDEIWVLDSLENFRSRLSQPEPCRTCDVYEICRGGCKSTGCSDNIKGIDSLAQKFMPIVLGIEDAPKSKTVFGQSIISLEDNNT